MNSFILTPTGASLVINGHPYVIERSHPNYDQVLDAIRARTWAAIPPLVNKALNLVTMASGRIQVDVEGGVVLIDNREVHNAAINHLFEMMKMGFDGEPLANFIANLYQNPSQRAIAATYVWIQTNGITITEDGYLIAYKRVQDDYTSFYDGKTRNDIGTTVSLPWSMCDPDGNETCSTGLHFCSHAYLPQYHGGIGRVMILKINPKDITAIPTDYNFAKGRACSYFIMGELSGDARTLVEHNPVITSPVIAENDLVEIMDGKKTSIWVAGYEAGYKDGRGKKAIGTSDDWKVKQVNPQEYHEGYEEGRDDGRRKNPKRYGSTPAVEHVMETETSKRVRTIIAEQLGVGEALLEHDIVSDLGADSLDVIETIMAIEDEFELEITDEDAEKINTVKQAVDYVQRRISGEEHK